jgi:hypothetical protein
MKAYVKVRKGNFPDVNYYTAWKGFVEMGYDVFKFEEDQEGTIDVTEDTPVFAGVGSCRKIIKRVWGWDYTGINPYPSELMTYMQRKVERKKWADARQEALEGHMFIKPVIQKQFTGAVLNTILDTIRTGKVDPDHEVYVVEPVDFLSEWRVYVHENEIVGVKPYFHKEVDGYTLTPEYSVVKRMIEDYKPSAPVAYGMDVGIMNLLPQYGSGRVTSLVEVNDGICLGNYGLDPIHYAEMISSRWMELITKATIPEVTLTIPDKPITGRMGYRIGNFTVDREEYWKITDAERQALHDKHNPGSKAIPFDPKFAAKLVPAMEPESYEGYNVKLTSSPSDWNIKNP